MSVGELHEPMLGIAERIAEEAPYTGGPLQDFERVGRDSFIVLLENGLRPDHNLLDFGCGALRLGYWLVRFLEPENYYGIEPYAEMVEPGIRHALGVEVMAAKRPRFSDNAECDMGVFGVKFDYVVARSIFTHTCPGMLLKTLQSFALSANEEGVFLASYWPTGSETAARFVPAEAEDGDDLSPDDMRFIPHVTYSFAGISEWAEACGLSVSVWDQRPAINGQVWLRFCPVRATDAGEKTEEPQ